MDAAWNKLVIADVSLGVGIAATTLAAVFFLWPRPNPEAPSSVAMPVLLPTTKGASLQWQARF